jgi:hypothetical protein
MQLLDLPNEILDEIVIYLPYPDQLSLKFTSTYWHRHIQLSVRDRVDWLLHRAQNGLPFPQSQRCSFKSDVLFCASSEVRKILRDRRTHIECIRHSRNQRCLVTNTYGCKPSLEMQITSQTGDIVLRNIAIVIQLVRAHAFTILVAGLCTILQTRQSANALRPTHETA